MPYLAEGNRSSQVSRYALLALGKLGSRELTATSDLDLILVYDAPQGAESRGGPRALPASTYYARLAQRFINALTALTSEGALYEVDMRLRPSGNSGPVASSLAAFQRYHRESAWTWEQMALTRARIVAGSAALAATVSAEVKTVLTRPREAAALAREVAEMRQRIEDEHRNPSPWHVKHRRGGMVDIEFVTQYLLLREAPRRPELLEPNTIAALQGLARAGALDAAAAADLTGALALWRNVQSLLKLIAEEPFDEKAAPPALKAILASGAGQPDFAALKEAMEAAALRARARYEEIVTAEA